MAAGSGPVLVCRGTGISSQATIASLSPSINSGRYGISRYRSPFVKLTVSEWLFVIPLREQELSLRGRLNMQVVTNLFVPCTVVSLPTIEGRRKIPIGHR